MIFFMIFGDLLTKNDENQGNRRKSQEMKETGKKSKRSLKLRQDRPGTGGRAGPVDFGPRKKKC